MIVTLICEDRLYGELLPEKPRGQYWLKDETKAVTDPKRRILGIEAENGVWKIKSSRKFKLYEFHSNAPIEVLELQAGQMYIVQFAKGKKGYIFTEDYTEDRCIFRKYVVLSNTTINIGKNIENQISIENPFVSNVHAQLSLSGNTWTLLDNNSKNGVYVNEQRIDHAASVKAGDVIYILGVKIVIGNHFLAINNPDGKVQIRANALSEYTPQKELPYEAPEEIEEQIYYRSPRFSRGIVPLKLKVDAPTNKEAGDDTPMMLVLGPSLIMGVASFSTGIMSIVNARTSGGSIMSVAPTMIMSVSMLAGMVLFPFIMKKRDKKMKREKEEARKEKYLKYLNTIRAEIHQAATMQKEIWNENFPPVISQLKSSNFYEMVLWSRVIGQKNFLTLRVGIGDIPLEAELNFPEERFQIDDDDMRNEVNQFRAEKKILSDVPVTYSLLEHRVSGIVGNGNVISGMLHNLLMQIVALHSYDEVKLVFICDESNLKKYEYVRWMQHVWDNDFHIRFLAATPEEVRNLSSYFLRVMEDYKGERAKSCPHYVVISTSKALSDGCAFIAELLKNDTIQSFHYIAVYDELKNLPKECTKVIQVRNNQGSMFDYKAFDGNQILLKPDLLSAQEAMKAVKDIAGYKLDLQNGKYALPNMITFLQMFHVGKYEHLNIASRWKENNPVISLRSPVGVNSDGGLFYLDLHEKEHGPHGLIAGMTGSGKSEFIITFVLSLAVSYSPDDIAFILIDYKGGGLVGAFDNEQYHLPHLAGTITNLDGASITRSLLSIQSELRRRQALFNEARNRVNEGTMDIYKYQKLYRNGVMDTPVPHLFIISDEFAELKDQQPEFMSQLISTARIGRSLGVHLILATQKPSGVVNEQIWANSRFKVCLKVQDRADSMDMLKRPEAAELLETGRFYLQVGYNELFEMGQSAWCGAPYVPENSVERQNDESVMLIDRQGTVLEEAKPQKKSTSGSDQNKKQIVEIARYIAQIAKEEHMSAKPLWLPEIPAVITVEYLEEKYGYQADSYLNPAVGELDDPFNQSQRLLTVPLTEKGNVLCYGAAGSGKENFLTTMLYSLYRHHSSRELNVYILDFGAETLQMFADAPQTGDFVVSGEEEKIQNLFRYLNQELKRRKKLFSEAGGDYLSYTRQGKEKVPNLLVLINDYTGFSEQYEELNDSMPSLTRDCTKYGIFFVLTCNSSMGIRYKLQQNFNQAYVLQLNDKTDYISILGNTGGVYPSRITGRGIFREKEVYEFQTAYVADSPENVADEVRCFCKKLRETSKEEKAIAIPVMPKVVSKECFDCAAISFEHIPIGIRYESLKPRLVNLKKINVLQILAMDKQDISPFAEGAVELLQEIDNCEVYVLDPGRQLVITEAKGIHYITEQVEKTVAELFEMLVERHNMYKLNNTEFPKTADVHPVVVLLMGLAQIRTLLSEDGLDKLHLILDKTNGKFFLSYWAMDNYTASNTYATEDWCSGDGLWIGNGAADQIRLKIRNSGPMLRRITDHTSGIYIQRGMGEGIKLLTLRQAEREEEDE